jgi:tRNA-specific 2-thiouridylase
MGIENKKQRIVVAISGGVDSSVAAAIYCKKGYDVIGVTLRLKDDAIQGEHNKSCGSLTENEQARQVCEQLGIPHYFIDREVNFKEKILEYAWNDYANCRTPNPCVLCNVYMKFGELIQFAKEKGAIGLITGHHARIEHSEMGSYLLKGHDPSKDQSYFLAMLTEDQLAFSHFPVGEITKAEVRKYARELNLETAEKKDSQDVCFNVPGEPFSETLRHFFSDSPKIGYFISPDGKKLQKHKGVHLYTIGQRRGLGVALGKPAYVVHIDRETYNIQLAIDETELLTSCCYLRDVHWHDKSYELDVPVECEVKVRYRHRPVNATIIPLVNSRAKLILDSPQRAVTPGQLAVSYNGERVIGAGWIEY